MMRLLWVLWCFVFVAIGIPAQDSEKKVTNKSELSGTWELLDDDSIYTRIGGKSDENYTLQITFSGEEMKIIRTIETDNGKTAYDLLLYTDKRGERNVTPLFDKGIKSFTTWHRNRVERTYRYNASIGRSEISVREEYRVSKDGSRLIVENFRTTDLPRPRVFGRTKLVFERKN